MCPIPLRAYQFKWRTTHIFWFGASNECPALHKHLLREGSCIQHQRASSLKSGPKPSRQDQSVQGFEFSD